MGRLKKIYVMRLDALAIYVFFGIFIILLYAIFGYMKAFFISYQTLQYLFNFGQSCCVLLGIAIVIMIYFQYKKRGSLRFISMGLLISKHRKVFFIMTLFIMNLYLKIIKVPNV